MEKYYRHTQFGTALVAAFFMSIVIAAFFFRKDGWHPLAVSVIAILVLCILLFYSLSVEIDKGIITCQFGIGLIKKVFKLAEIVNVQTVKNKWYYGWGIRLTPHGWLFNISGLQGVEITLRSGKKYRIGTDEPDRLAASIQENLRNIE
jgi:hypothetical protein